MAAHRRNVAVARGFTLVELLVVIGIIALLISILLPALSRARAQAGAIKCASQLRQVGLSFQMYAMDNSGYWPPSRLAAAYNIDGVNYTSSNPAYWQNFVAKYATKLKVGTAISSNKSQDAANARNTVLWGCPSFEGFIVGAQVTGGNIGSNAGPINTIYTGYGMNLDPLYGQMTPPSSGGTFEGSLFRAFDPPPVSPPSGAWFKAKQWTRPTERALIADGRAYTIECHQPPTLSTYPDCVVAQHVDTMLSLWSTTDNGQCSIDMFRHGKPPPSNGDSFATGGGRIAFNILYCDGHATTCVHGSDAYKALRMKFPG